MYYSKTGTRPEHQNGTFVEKKRRRRRKVMNKAIGDQG